MISSKKEKPLYSKIMNFVIAAIIPIALIVFWEYVSTNNIVNPNALPAPSTLFENFFRLIEKGKLQEGLKISFFRVITGFLIGSLSGITIGFFMGLFPKIKTLLSSLVSFLRPMPLMALIPVFIITLGIGEVTNIAVISIGTFWPSLLNTITGIQNTDQKLIELAKVYRVSKIKIIFKIVLPSAASSIITGIRLSAGIAWSSVVAAEMIGASSGIGYNIMYAREVARSADLFTSVIVIGIIGLLIEKILVFVQNICDKKFKGIV